MAKVAEAEARADPIERLMLIQYILTKRPEQAERLRAELVEERAKLLKQTSELEGGRCALDALRRRRRRCLVETTSSILGYGSTAREKAVEELGEGLEAEGEGESVQANGNSSSPGHGSTHPTSAGWILQRLMDETARESNEVGEHVEDGARGEEKGKQLYLDALARVLSQPSLSESQSQGTGTALGVVGKSGEQIRALELRIAASRLQAVVLQWATERVLHHLSPQINDGAEGVLDSSGEPPKGRGVERSNVEEIQSSLCTALHAIAKGRSDHTSHTPSRGPQTLSPVLDSPHRANPPVSEQYFATFLLL